MGDSKKYVSSIGNKEPQFQYWLTVEVSSVTYIREMAEHYTFSG